MNYEDEYRALAGRMAGLLAVVLEYEDLRGIYLKDQIAEVVETWVKLAAKDARRMATATEHIASIPPDTTAAAPLDPLP